MTDKVYPNTAANGIAAVTKPNPTFPATKAQLYGATRPAYRPQPLPRRHRRGRNCCCRLCLWLTFIILILILLAAIASAVIYFLYRPQRISFAVTSLKLSTFNLTSSSVLTSNFNLNISSRNRNKNLVFFYNPISITVFSNGIDVGDGSIPGFVHPKKNTTLLKTAIKSHGKELDSDSVSSLKSSMKRKNGMPLTIRIDTKVKVKMSGLKTPKVGIRVSCGGITGTVPTGKTAVTARTSKAKCKVQTRIKIWKWYI